MNFQITATFVSCVLVILSQLVDYVATPLTVYTALRINIHVNNSMLMSRLCQGVRPAGGSL